MPKQSHFFDERTRRAYRAALDVLRHELPVETAEQFAAEFECLAEFLETEQLPRVEIVYARDETRPYGSDGIRRAP